MTQKDITFVAEFLTEHFNEAPDLYNRKGKYFNVEKVGQDVIGKSMNQAICIPLYRDARRWNNKTSNLHYLLFTILEDSLYKMCILRRHTDISHTYSCLDAQFYDDETVTVVLKDTVGREGRDRLLVQLPLSLVYNGEDSAEYQFTGSYSTRLDEQRSAIPTRTMHFEKHWRLLESMKAQYVAGNGFRKVSCVVSIKLLQRVTEATGSLSSNLRHVRVFEMDIDDEWELDESSDEEEEASNKPVKIKEEVLSESEAENQQTGTAALAPEMVIKVEKLDPELDS
ncbi:anaphase-promoting complex subunit 4-like [Pontoporia blainvillei]|uniref:Anaphase-promoting complex subunit 4-like n=1 Tax=Pontoporia blainvillei TaxID=48723 RepID=A0ABX0S146_PONBL|nr:anaphase-promoting complex subunit 4-like [Pontoporia blainvillei]